MNNVNFAHPDVKKSLWEMADSILPFIGLWWLAYWSLRVSYALTMAIAVVAAGFMMRIFIIFHDCGHGSFFHTRRANTIAGYITGILTFSAFDHWTHLHAIHHATAGDLDRRGVGDVLVLTVKEYQALPRLRKIAYSTFRNPAVMLLIGAPLVFLGTHRLYARNSAPREKASVIYTNLALLILGGILGWLVGWKALLLVQLPIVWIGSAVGVWLFYVEHQFQGVYWARHSEWSFEKAGLLGASYYQLPALLRWFSGNIGYHHIHHLNPRIPGYNLAACYRGTPEYQQVKPLTLLSSLESLKWRLYDEDAKRLVGWKELKQKETP